MTEYDKISFGDEYWQYTPEKERKIWSEAPLKFFKGTKNKKIVEIGSGYGIFLYYFSKNNKAYGIEIDRARVNSSIKLMKKLKRKVKVVQGDARKLPYKNDFFDIVFCHGVIEHFNPSEKAIAEGYRILKKSGLAMYSVPARISFFVPLKFLQQIADKLLGTRMWQAGYEKSFTPWKFKKMLENEGFKVIHFEISETQAGRRFPIVGKILRILDKVFWKMQIGGRFMYAVCKKQ